MEETTLLARIAVFAAQGNQANVRPQRMQQQLCCGRVESESICVVSSLRPAGSTAHDLMLSVAGQVDATAGSLCIQDRVERSQSRQVATSNDRQRALSAVVASQ